MDASGYLVQAWRDASLPDGLPLRDDADLRVLQQQLDRLVPHRPGQPDLYVVGMAGDASEKVFAQEVQYLQALMDRRFGTEGRSIGLYNASPPIPLARPQASLDNLRRTLHHIGGLMDADEDILLLYLTMHGSADHVLGLVGREVIAGLDPEQLRDALDTSGIRNRVVVVSACYSGGFAPVLENEHTLFIAAARHDRTSFGCGAASEITWFGQAWMLDGLNARDSFILAFQDAREAVRSRERARGFQPSHPQLVIGGKPVKRRLAAWQAQLPPSAPPLAYPWPVSAMNDGADGTADSNPPTATAPGTAAKADD